jgi:hypothetical protein
MQIENMNSAKIQILKRANVNAVYEKNGKMVVQVTKKLPLSELKEEDIIPSYLEGLKTDVIEKGEIILLQKHRPLIGGISCCEPYLGSATLGGIVRDSTDGSLVGLTCNHCAGTLFDINYTWPIYGNTAVDHIKLLQPSPNDGGSSPDDEIGAVKRAVATQFGEGGINLVDCSIVTLSADLAKTDIKNIHRGPFPFLLETYDYQPGTVVYKNGRTTGLTEGVVVSTNVGISATNGDGDQAYFYNQIMIESETAFIESGDSGSLILIKSLGIWKIIGMLIAGNISGTQGFASRMDHITDLLNIEAWDGSIISNVEYPFILANGKCYTYIGYTTEILSHNHQKQYNSCIACKSQAYPKNKIHTVL